jgi:hypothetical protein
MSEIARSLGFLVQAKTLEGQCRGTFRETLSPAYSVGFSVRVRVMQINLRFELDAHRHKQDRRRQTMMSVEVQGAAVRRLNQRITMFESSSLTKSIY